MMGAVAFDTLKFANRLESVGISRPQAMAEAEVLSEIFDLNLRNLATKDDLLATQKELQHEVGDLRKDMANANSSLRKDMDVKHDALRKDMDNKFVNLEQRIDTKLSDMKFELLKWIIGLAIAQTGLVFGLLKLFPATVS
jgi:hypothetical protein